jgi:hypothetical protein
MKDNEIIGQEKGQKNETGEPVSLEQSINRIT